MFNNLFALQIRQCLGFYVAAFAAVWLGMCILVMTISGDFPQPAFTYAPSIVFFTMGCLAWCKAIDTLMHKTLQYPQSSLLLTLPVSEQDMIISKVTIGTIGNTILYLIVAGMVVFYFDFYQDVSHMFTLLATMFIDYGYSSFEAAISIGMLPLLLLLEQAFFSLFLLSLTLLSNGRKNLMRLLPLLYMVLIVLQLILNIWLALSYEMMIAQVLPLVLTFGIMVLLGVLSILLYKLCVRHLKYDYMA